MQTSLNFKTADSFILDLIDGTLYAAVFHDSRAQHETSFCRSLVALLHADVNTTIIPRPSDTWVSNTVMLILGFESFEKRGPLQPRDKMMSRLALTNI